MSLLPPHLRYERKCVGHGLSIADAVSIVRRHPALFREAYPPRAVNNIYLDSAGLRDYHDHVDGVANRAKTRIRWYGQLHGPIAHPVLECKIKRGLVSGKVTHVLPSLAFNGQISSHVLNSSLERAELPERLRLALRCLQPTLVNRYQRQYWLSACGRLRLTLDWDLQFHYLHAHETSPAAFRSGPPDVIVELKYDPAHADFAATVTNGMPFRLSRCSKYVLGIESLGAA